MLSSAALAGAGRRALGSGVGPHAVLLAVIVAWSFNASILEVGLRHVRPLTFITGRYLIGAVALTALALASGERLRPVPPLRLLIPTGLLGVVLNQVAFSYGVHLSNAVDMSLIMGLAPICAAIAFGLAVRRRPPLRQVVALGLGFAGVVAVVLAGTRPGGGRHNLLGDLVGLGAPISWGVYVVVSAAAARRHRPAAFTAWTMWVALAMMLPAGAWDAFQPGQDWGPALLPLAYAGLVSTAAGYMAYFWALGRVGVHRTAIYTYLQPGLGAAIAALLLAEAFGPLQMLGAAAILLAAYLGSWSRGARDRTGEEAQAPTG